MKDFILGQSFKVLLLGGIALAGVFYYFLGRTNPNDVKIQKLHADIIVSTEKLKQTLEKTADKAKFQDDVERMSQTFRLALDYLPREIETQDLLKKIYAEARNAGVQLTHFRPKETVSKDFYDELPMDIELKGNFPGLVLFLSYVSKIPRIITIKDVELGDAVYIDSSATLKLKGTLMAYRYKGDK